MIMTVQRKCGHVTVIFCTEEEMSKLRVRAEESMCYECLHGLPPIRDDLMAPWDELTQIRWSTSNITPLGKVKSRTKLNEELSTK